MKILNIFFPSENRIHNLHVYIHTVRLFIFNFWYRDDDEINENGEKVENDKNDKNEKKDANKRPVWMKQKKHAPAKKSKKPAQKQVKVAPAAAPVVNDIKPKEKEPKKKDEEGNFTLFKFFLIRYPWGSNL